ncbi:RDD family protein [Saccharopolyspora sp. NPDC047091]|uniref:RDD family protein n=1 Tax=Saccharopolyspora sp. NPDC047091 TaxID=3155924 RepID=UPI0033C06716
MGESTGSRSEMSSQDDAAGEPQGLGGLFGRDPQQRWRGERMGLPENGQGSVATGGRRLLGFLIDIVLAALVAQLFTAPALPGNWSLVAWFAITVIPVAFFGFTPGMLLTGIWVARVERPGAVGLWRAVVRCAMTGLLVPAIIRNGDGRSWLDRLTGTVVVRR